MNKARTSIAALLLSMPTVLRSLRKVPLFGGVIHRMSHWLLPANESVWAQVRSGPARGMSLQLNPRTGEIYRRGEVERAIQNVLVERLRPGMVFYDLGANIGFFSLLAARLVGPTGRVFSFEPDAEVAARLRRNIARNAFTNTTVVEAGIWSASRTVRFVPSDTSSPDRGTGRIATTPGETVGVPIRCIALDDFIQTAPMPDAIKCDVEGAEVEVFLGAEQLLERQHPTIICEIHSEANDRRVRKRLAAFGYKCETVDGNHVLAVASSERLSDEYTIKVRECSKGAPRTNEKSRDGR